MKYLKKEDVKHIAVHCSATMAGQPCVSASSAGGTANEA